MKEYYCVVCSTVRAVATDDEHRIRIGFEACGRVRVHLPNSTRADQ